MAKKAENKNLPVKWEEEMARQAELAYAMEESTLTGRFFNTRGGQLTWNDMPIPNNEMGVIILDAVMENVYYPGKFDPEQPQAPLCFAFGREEASMTPHKIVVEGGNAQSPLCKDCEWNEWASSDTGRGKACRNVRRLALISAGNFDDQRRFHPFTDYGEYENGVIGFIKVPVTSVRGYAMYVKNIARVLKRPPFAILTKLSTQPDPKNQWRMVFEAINKAPDELMPILLRRHEEAMSIIEEPYQPFEDEPAARPRTAKTKAKPTTRRPAKTRRR